MKKRILLTLALASWWTLLLQGQSPPPPPTPTKPSQEKQDVGTVENRQPQNTASPTQTRTATVNKTSPEPDKADTNAKPAKRGQVASSKWNWSAINTGIVTFFTLILTGVGVFQYLSMRKQAGYMQRQADYMKEGLKLTRQAADAASQSVKTLNRARIVIDKTSFSENAYDSPDFTFKYSLKNKGHTTAYIVESRDATTVLETLPEIPPDCGPAIERHITIGPGQYVNLTCNYTKTETELEMLSKGKGDIIAHGIVKYRDEFGSEWETRYGMRCSRNDGSAHFVTLPGYNAAT